MRLKQLVENNYTGELQDTIVNLLTAIGAEGLNTVDTDQLILDLQQQGFSINKNSLFSMLNQMPIVVSANDETISIRPSGERPSDQPDGSQSSHVKKQAQKQAKKDRIMTYYLNRTEARSHA